jgi:nucleoside triphosphate pyrophosphatase
MATLSLWRSPLPLLLASASATRRALLEGAGLPVETEASGVDERALEAAVLAQEAASTEMAPFLARALAHAKATAVSRRRRGRLVVGADQTLACDGELFHKPVDAAEAAAHLARLAGRTHVLHSAVSVARDGEILRDFVRSARMTMRPLSRDRIARYLALAGEGATGSVGAYRVEGPGIHLFDSIEGDHATILGLPLLPLLAVLRELGCLDL